MFGTRIGQRGFKISAIGAPDSCIRQSVRALLDDATRARPVPSDWVYVNNFTAPHRPIALALPGLAKAMHSLVEDLKVSLPANFCCCSVTSDDDIDTPTKPSNARANPSELARLHTAPGICSSTANDAAASNSGSLAHGQSLSPGSPFACPALTSSVSLSPVSTR